MISIIEEIELINDIIDAAISHGGDAGGAYCSDWNSLEESIGEGVFAKGIDDKYAACSDAIRPIEEVDILDYCEDTKRWYCVVSEYSLDEICVNGLIVPDYKKGVKLEIYRDRYGTNSRIRSGFGHMCFVEIDVCAAVRAGKSMFYLCEKKSNKYFFVDYIPVSCFTVMKND